MSNNEMLGLLVVALATLSGLYFSFRGYEKKNRKEMTDYIDAVNQTSLKIAEESRKATEENTRQLILFNSNLKHMIESNNKRDEQIDKLTNGYDNHETRITVLEKTKYIKEYTR